MEGYGDRWVTRGISWGKFLIFWVGRRAQLQINLSPVLGPFAGLAQVVHPRHLHLFPAMQDRLETTFTKCLTPVPIRKA